MKKLILMLLICAINGAFAQPVARVLFTSNKVFVHRNGVQQPVSRGSVLKTGDTVITGKGALANIKYNNGTLVNIGDNSRYTLLGFSPQSKDIQVKAQLNAGKIRFKTKGKSRETLRTPMINLTILGTEGSVAVSAGQTWLDVVEGRVEAGGRFVQGSEVIRVTAEGIDYGVPFPVDERLPSGEAADGFIRPTRGTVARELAGRTEGFSAAADAMGQVQVAQVADQAAVIDGAIIGAVVPPPEPPLPPPPEVSIDISCISPSA